MVIFSMKDYVALSVVFGNNIFPELLKNASVVTYVTLLPTHSYIDPWVP